MPTFGQYETAQRLFLSGVGGIYALKSDDKKIIKVLHPPVGIWSDERIQEEIEGFRERAKIQKNAAKASRNWAPVHDAAAIRAAAGTGESTGGEALASQAEGGERPVADGAYAVMDRYERSVQSLLDGRVNVQNADLRALFTGIIQGLLDLRQTASRPHGALKASNILLANATDLASATVHLSDPAPAGALTPASDTRDLNQLARILYHLVHRRAYDDGTIGRNKDWDALGPNGENWRKLCGALMDGAAHQEECKFENILAQLPTWTAKPKKSKKPLLYAVAALLLVAGGIVGFIEYRRTHKTSTPEEWQYEALAYYSWFKDFNKDLTSDAGVKFREANPEISKIFVRADFDKYDPVRISNYYTSPPPGGWDEKDPNAWKALITNPPATVTKTDNPKKGKLLVQGVEDALAHWTVRQKLLDAATRYKELSWTKPTEELQAVYSAGSVPALYAEEPDPGIRFDRVNEDKTKRPKTIYQSLVQATEAYKLVTLVSGYDEEKDGKTNHIDGILERITKLPTHDVPLLGDGQAFKSAKAFAEQALANPPGNPGEALNNVKALAAALQKFEAEAVEPLKKALATPDVDFAELKKDPTAGPNPAATIAHYQALASAIPGYVTLKTDTRTPKAWTDRLANKKIDINTITAPPNDAQLEAINKRYGELDKNIAEIAGLPLLVKSNMGERISGITSAFDALEKAINEHPGFMTKEKFAQIVADQEIYITPPNKLPDPINGAANPVQERWKLAQGALIKTVKGRTLEEFRTTHIEDEKKFREVLQFYADAGQALPDKDSNRGELLALSNDPKLTKWADDTRDSVLTYLLTKAVPQPEDPSQIDYQKLLAEGSAYRILRTAALTQYQSVCKISLAFLKDHAALAKCLDQLYLLPDEAEPSSGKKWRDLQQALQKNPFLADATIPVDIMKTLTGTYRNSLLTAENLKTIQRAADLLALDKETDYSALLKQAQAPVPELALAAWRKLGDAAISEDTAYLKDEDDAENKLNAHVAALKALNAKQADALAGEIKGQRPKRWERWAAKATTAKNLELAVKQAANFGVTITKDKPEMFYYQALLALRDFSQPSPPTPAPTEEALKGAAQDGPAYKFINAVKDLPLGTPPNTDMQKLLTDMGESLKPLQGSFAEKQGPELAGWGMTFTPDFQKRTFSSKDPKFAKYPLDFQMMTVNRKIIYLCTTEMSVGLFNASMNAYSGKLPDGTLVVDNKNHPAPNDHWFKPVSRALDSWEGVRSWYLNNTGVFNVNQDWTIALDAAASADKYPTNATTPKGPSEGDPPMQRLSPWAAAYAAQLLGCRLPTSEEWQAAYRQFEGQAGMPTDVWNLRGEGAGASWGTQQRHALANKFIPFPDDGIFLSGNVKTGPNAQPWTAGDLAKLAAKDNIVAARITPDPSANTPYKNNTLWFMPVDKENPNNAKIVMHHLVGNVAEYVYDGDKADEVIKGDKKPDPKAINDMQPGSFFVIGGSALSPPEMAFNEKLAIPNDGRVKTGYSDVGFRLAYTAPRLTIVQVLQNAFKDGKLPGPRGAGAKVP